MPFVVQPSSEKGGSGIYEYGKYPVKIYTIDGVLIYQTDNGSDNTNKSPLGGVISQSSSASSMLDAIANPITFYGGNTVINQAGHSGDLYNYYWTSYSRGTDGNRIVSNNEPSWHNAYLDGYIPLRAKSIYDPCPYLYRIPSNGTWNQFSSNPGWTEFSYLGGVSWSMNTKNTWISMLDSRIQNSGALYETSRIGIYTVSTGANNDRNYSFVLYYDKRIYSNNAVSFSWAYSVRCIEQKIRNLTTT